MVVNYVDEIPGILVAVDMFTRPGGAEWPNWDTIAHWNEGMIESYPWSQCC